MQRISGFAVLFLTAGLAASASAQNAIQNGGFATDLSGWHIPAVQGSATFSSGDADGAASSGSALVTSTAAEGNVLVSPLKQCVAVVPGTSYVASADVFFPSGQASSGRAKLTFFWDSSVECNGFISGISLSADSTVVPADQWNNVTQSVTAPGGAVSALVQLGIVKTPAGGSLAANFDKISLAPVAGGDDDALIGYIPGAGSLHGSHGSNFKTGGQTTNPGATPISVRLVYHPAGQTASDGDPHLSFDIPPGATVSSDDFVAAMGQSGLGTVDVFSTVGGPTPLPVARVYNDAGAAGTTGFSEGLVVPPIPPGGTAVLIGPPDTARYRFNVGVRTFASPVTLAIQVKDKNGSVVHSQVTALGAAFFQQYSAHDFLDGFDIGPDESIVIESTGQALFYGALTDDVTNDPSVQFAVAK
jgi:hypothetical protein